MKQFLFLLIVLMMLTNVGYSQTVQDSLAMVALYHSTNGDNWTNNTNWLSDQPISTWYGVTVSNGSISYIDLWNNNLSGNIPPQIGDLTNLVVLRLNNNKISGPIPPEIGNLFNLKDLILVSNNLSGELPHEIQGLLNLQRLHLSGNQLSGTIPFEIGGLTQLKNLDLATNNFTGSIPREIGNLKNLERLDIVANQLTGFITEEVFTLPKLERLNLSYNELTGELPSSIGELENLKYLNLSNNRFTGKIPAEIGMLSRLTQFRLENNQFSGEIPLAIWNLGNLEIVALNNNRISGALPQAINQLNGLKELIMQNNEIEGLPALTMGKLETLRVYSNKLTFEDLEPNVGVASKYYDYIPQDSIGNSMNITLEEREIYKFSVICEGKFNLYQWYKNNLPIPGATKSDFTITSLKLSDAGSYNCRVTNSVVPGLTIYSRPIKLNVLYTPYLDSLACVALYHALGGPDWQYRPNWLKGTFESWEGVRLENRRVIELGISNSKYFNPISGNIPDEIGLLRKLRRLTISGFNILTGTVPSEIWKLTELQHLNLSQNNLTGQIPQEVVELTELQYLNLNHNNLTGQIPQEVGKLTELKGLRLDHNNLTGQIPQEILKLTELQQLNLSQNNLTGQIPQEVVELTELQYLYLSDNNLTGQIPQEVGKLTELKGLQLDYNNLTGQIPQEVGKLTELKDLRLDHNNLTGQIPKEIWNLKKLSVFSASNNQLAGQLPSEIGNCKSLSYLNLRSNQLSGTIPPEIGNLRNFFHSFVLSVNNFSGTIPKELGSIDASLLFLSSNQFDSISNDLVFNVRTKNVSLSHNKIRSLPSGILDNEGVRKFSLGRNEIKGPLPARLLSSNGMRLLYFLNLRDNQITEFFPRDFQTDRDLFFNELDLSYNNLSEMPLIKNTFHQIHYNKLDVTENQISYLPDFQKSNILIKDLRIGGNKLTFEHIEPNIILPITPFVYFPQQPIGNQIDTTVLVGSIFSMYAVCGAEYNQYQWYKNNQPLPGAKESVFTIQNLQKSDAGSYHCAITNTLATQLTLFTRPVNLFIVGESHLDSLALVAFFHQMGGPDWINKNNWLLGPLHTWYGVTLDEGRVIKLMLSGNKLRGTLSKETFKLTELKVLDLSGNQISGMLPEEINSLKNLSDADLSRNEINRLPQLQPNAFKSLNLAYNRLDFAALEHNMDMGLEEFIYWPQEIIGEQKELFGCRGSGVTLNISVGGSKNKYQWYRGNLPVPGATSSRYEIRRLSFWSTGSYNCRITNNLVPDLTLYSATQQINYHPVPPSFEIAGNRIVSQNETVIYTVPEIDFVNYNWRVSGGEIVSQTSPKMAEIIWRGMVFGRVNVTAINPCDVSTSSSISVIIRRVKTLSPIPETNDIIVYPNPASDRLFIELEFFRKDVEYRIRILNSMGQVVLHEDMMSEYHELNISPGLSKGIYLVEVTDSKGNLAGSKKIIIQ